MNLTNQFLIAMPSLQDRNFSRAVTLICEHSPDGALGIIVNQPIEGVFVREVFAQLSIPCTHDELCDQNVFRGGPVQLDQGFIVHQPPGSWAATHPVSEDLGLTSSKDILVALGEGRGPERALIVFGYAGWSAGQLEQELAENSWLTGPVDPAVIFETPVERRWHAAAALLGVDVALLASSAGHG